MCFSGVCGVRQLRVLHSRTGREEDRQTPLSVLFVRLVPRRSSHFLGRAGGGDGGGLGAADGRVRFRILLLDELDHAGRVPSAEGKEGNVTL